MISLHYLVHDLHSKEASLPSAVDASTMTAQVSGKIWKLESQVVNMHFVISLFHADLMV